MEPDHTPPRAPEPRIRAFDAARREWVWVRPRVLAPSPLAAAAESSESSQPPTPPPKSPRHYAYALPPGAAPPAVGLPAAFGRFSVTSAPEPSKARRQARTKSLFSRRKDQPAEARAASWLSAIGTILKRKRAASAPGPADPKPPVQLHDFGPVPPPTPAWVNAAAWDAYASLAARSEAKRR